MPVNVPMLRSDVDRMYTEGYSVADAVALLRCTEEVNPSLAEDVALRRMKMIENRTRNPRTDS